MCKIQAFWGIFRVVAPQDFNLVEALVDQIDLLDSRKTRMNVNSFQEDRENVIPEQDNPR